MLTAILLAMGVVLFGLPGLFARRARRLPPTEWSRLCGVAVCAGAAMIELAALLAGAPRVLQAAGVPALAHLCAQAMNGLVPGGAPVGWTAAFVAAALPGLAAVGARRAHAAAAALMTQAPVGHQSRSGGYDLVVLPIAGPLAVCAAGRPGRIFISDGLVAALDGEQVALVVRHEAAHLDLGHQRWLAIAAALDHSVGVLTPLRRGTTAWRCALERCADEAAAGADPGRRRQLRRALLDLSIGTAGPALAAFGAVDTILERSDALLEDPPVGDWAARLAVYGPAASSTAVAAFAALAWLVQTGTVLALAGRCSP